jgi:hypothetical protein
MLISNTFKVLYGTGASPEAKKEASDLIKSMVAAGDICFKCRKNPAVIGAHGVRDGWVYDEYWCASCYVRIHRQGSNKEATRLANND